MENIGERIKYARKSANLTQKDFAKRVLVSASYLSRVESNKETPTDMLVKLIALEFNINYDWLLNGNGRMNIKERDFDYFARELGGKYKEDISALLPELKNSLSQLSDSDYLNAHTILSNLMNLFNTELKPSYKTLVIEKYTNFCIDFIEALDFLVNTNINNKEDMLKFHKFLKQLSPDIEKFFDELISIIGA